MLSSFYFLTRVLIQLLQSARVNWGPLSPFVIPNFLPPELPPIFTGDRLLVYAFLKGTENSLENSLPQSGTISLMATTGRQQFEFPVSFNRTNNDNNNSNNSTTTSHSRTLTLTGNRVHRLAAQHALKNLQKNAEMLDENLLKTQSLELALKYADSVWVDAKEGERDKKREQRRGSLMSDSVGMFKF